MNNFLAENKYRAYPFITDTVGEIENQWVVSAGITTGSSPDITVSTPIQLSSIYLDGDIVFEVAADAVVVLTFRVPTSAAYGTTVFSSSQTYTDTGTDTDFIDSCYTHNWFGYITVGDVGTLVTQLGGGDIVFSVNPQFEPSTVARVGKGSVTSINIANLDRERILYADECAAPEWPILRGSWIKETCVDSDVVFSSGYNTRITVKEDTNTIRFSPIVGAGKGEVCEPILLYDAEEPLVEGGTLEGATRCGEAITRINLATGRFVQVNGSKFVPVDNVPEEHRIDVYLERSSAGSSYTEFV